MIGGRGLARIFHLRWCWNILFGRCMRAALGMNTEVQTWVRVLMAVLANAVGMLAFKPSLLAGSRISRKAGSTTPGRVATIDHLAVPMDGQPMESPNPTNFDLLLAALIAGAIVTFTVKVYGLPGLSVAIALFAAQQIGIA